VERKKHGGLTQIVKIGDFGLAQFIPKSGYFPGEKGIRPGKPLYMAPELLQGKDYDGKACDIYSLGISLLILLTRCNDPTFIQQIITYGIDKTFKAYGLPSLRISAKNLLTRMLCMIPEKRITLMDILKHDYLATSPLQS